MCLGLKLVLGFQPCEEHDGLLYYRGLQKDGQFLLGYTEMAMSDRDLKLDRHTKLTMNNRSKTTKSTRKHSAPQKDRKTQKELYEEIVSMNVEKKYVRTCDSNCTRCFQKHGSHLSFRMEAKNAINGT